MASLLGAVPAGPRAVLRVLHSSMPSEERLTAGATGKNGQAGLIDAQATMTAGLLDTPADPRITIHQSPFTIHESPFTSHHSRVTIHESRVTNHVPHSNLQIHPRPRILHQVNPRTADDQPPGVSLMRFHQVVFHASSARLRQLLEYLIRHLR